MSSTNEENYTKFKREVRGTNYSVWVGGVEVNDTFMPKEKAVELANLYRLRGYQDVHVEKYSSISPQLKSYLWQEFSKNKRLKPVLILQNKCRARHSRKSIEEMVEWCQTKCPVQCRYDKRYPFEEAYIIHGIGELTKNQFKNFRTSTIAFTMIPEYNSNGDEVHNYFTAYGYNGAVFVKDFKEGILETTQDKMEAKHFYLDDEADKVLEYLRDVKHPWTIALHDFKGYESVSACVHYPNYNWSNNGNLQPSLINKTVQEWCKDHETS